MGLTRRFWNVCLKVAADTLADLEGLRDEIRTEAGTVAPAPGLGRHAHRAGRGRGLSRLRRRREAPAPFDARG